VGLTLTTVVVMRILALATGAVDKGASRVQVEYKAMELDGDTRALVDKWGRLLMLDLDLEREFEVETSDSRVTGPLRESLAMLWACQQLELAAQRAAADVARIAVGQGADYTLLGRMVGITRQGARKRWPGLILRRRGLVRERVERESS
jgi:hypothetical protein